MNKNTPQPPQTETSRYWGWFRAISVVLFVFVIVTNIGLYSLYQSMLSQVSSLEHRVERLNLFVSETVSNHRNAEKIEKIEQRVVGIDGHVQSMVETIKAQNEEKSTK